MEVNSSTFMGNELIEKISVICRKENFLGITYDDVANSIFYSIESDKNTFAKIL
jgi:hypothetical protein